LKIDVLPHILPRRFFDRMLEIAMECGLAFFGAERVLFGTDMPFDPEKGPGFIRDTIGAMERMGYARPKAKIYEGTGRMLRLRLK
jgi:hypothetical protein